MNKNVSCMFLSHGVVALDKKDVNVLKIYQMGAFQDPPCSDLGYLSYIEYETSIFISLLIVPDSTWVFK